MDPQRGHPLKTVAQTRDDATKPGLPGKNRSPGPPAPNSSPEESLRPVTARLRGEKQSREALVRDDGNVPLSAC